MRYLFHIVILIAIYIIIIQLRVIHFKLAPNRSVFEESREKFFSGIQIYGTDSGYYVTKETNFIRDDIHKKWFFWNPVNK